MTLQGRPRTFTFAGVSDALDEKEAFPGACQAICNLIPDLATKDVWVSRPAPVQVANLNSGVGALTGATTISLLAIIGNHAYGMVASSRNPGKDEPFSFNLTSQTIEVMGNVTNANTPFTQPLTGTWTPPTWALMGKYLIITHPGFSGVAGQFFGWIDTSTPSAPVWNAGNTATNALPAIPVAVAQYMGRAWFAVNIPSAPSAVYFTDAGALAITNNPATGVQILTFGDNIPITALVGLPLQNMLGGIVQSLMVFKGASGGSYNIYQVTGDISQVTSSTIQVGTTTSTVLSSSLNINALNVATSTLAVNSVAPTPKGLLFVAPDGLRLLNQQGQVEDPIGANGMGVNAPFYFIPFPSRICAAANPWVYRVTVQNTLLNGSPWVEYWFDLIRQKWSGPHTSPFALIQPYGNTFIGVSHANNSNGLIFQSDVVLSPTSVFDQSVFDNNGTHGNQYGIVTSNLDDRGDMSEHTMIENTINGVLSSNGISLQCFDMGGASFQIDLTTNYPLPGNSPLAAAQIPSSGFGPTWGSFVWGQALWGVPVGTFRTRRIDWPYPIVYRRIAFSLLGNCDITTKIGNMFIREETLGYLQQVS